MGVRTKIPEGVKHFLSDLCDPQLLVIKALYFTLLAAVVLLWPQFTVHQREIGLTQYQTAVCSASVSALVIFMPFCSGFVGDKLGNFKKLLSGATLMAGVLALLFTAVPSARINTTAPVNTTAMASSLIDTTDDVTVSSSLNTTTTALNMGIIPTTSPSLNTATTETPPPTVVDQERLSFTFWVYLAVRVCYGGLQAVSYTLFEAAVMAHTQTHGVDYGFQRAWGTLAVIISSSLSGYLINLSGSFSVIFYVSAGLQVAAAGLVLLLRLEYKLPAQKLTWDILEQIRQAKVVMFFTAMLATGVFFGYLETFMYRYLIMLGGSTVLVGLTVTVGAPFELIVTILASYIVGKVGHAPIIMFGLLSQAIRLFGQSVLVDPWWVLPLEVFESLTNGVMSTAAVMYCTSLFTLQSIASFRGILAVVYFGIGKLLGAMVGAEITEMFGYVTTFRIMSAAALLSSITYCCAFYALKKCRSDSITTTERGNPTTTTTSAVAVRNGCRESTFGQSEDGKGGIDNPVCYVADT